MASRRLRVEPEGVVHVPARGIEDALDHVFDARTIRAVDAALAARRPLLVRGEPGAGKSQLARAVAQDLGAAFIPMCIDARTEARDLKWTFDAVARLADAQVVAARGLTSQEQIDAELAEERYLRPGPLWWAFDWLDAKDLRLAHQPETPDDWKPADGTVVLLDEIDKADSDVPNGLLEALGSGEFAALHRRVTAAPRERPILVLITTNEERSLPDAFVRRCLVLQLGLPSGAAELVAFLVRRGRAHFGRQLSDVVLTKAAEMLCDDREEAGRVGVPRPGQAEYLDLLRAVRELASEEDERLAALEELREFTYRKHPESDGQR